MRRRRPDLRIELTGLGIVDPFGLRLVAHPPGSGFWFLEDPRGAGPKVPVEAAGLSLVGAGQALLSLSVRWMTRAGRCPEGPDPPFGEVRLAVRRRESRLMAALLRRHLARLPEPPGWMPELLASLEQIEEFLRWDVPDVPENEPP